jgi:hypothetical protein
MWCGAGYVVGRPVRGVPDRSAFSIGRTGRGTCGACRISPAPIRTWGVHRLRPSGPAGVHRLPRGLGPGRPVGFVWRPPARDWPAWWVRAGWTFVQPRALFVWMFRTAVGAQRPRRLAPALVPEGVGLDLEPWHCGAVRGLTVRRRIRAAPDRGFCVFSDRFADLAAETCFAWPQGRPVEYRPASPEPQREDSPLTWQPSELS